MAINSVTDLRNTDPGQTAFTVRQSPVGAQTSCHAVQVTQGARSGVGAGINVVSDNTEAPAIRARAAGPLVRLYNAGNTLVFEVDNTGAVTTGSFPVSGNISVTSVTTTTGVVVGTTLAVAGLTTLTGGVGGNTTLHNGNLTIDGTTKGYRLRQDGGGLDLEATGADLVISNWSGAAFNGTQRSYLRMSADAQNVQVAGKVEFVDALYGATKHTLDGAANTIGFFGTAAVGKQTVTGAKGGNAAVASIMAALVAYGLVTDSTAA